MVYSSLNVRPSSFVLIPLRYRYQSLYLVQFRDVYDGTDAISVSMTRSQNLQVTVVYPAWNGMEWNRYHSNLWLDLQCQLLGSCSLFSGYFPHQRPRLHCQCQTSSIVPETCAFVGHVMLTHKSHATLMDLSVPSAAQCLSLVHSPKPIKADIPR